MRRFGPMGEAWAVPIYAALIAASATVLGAFLNSAKDRRSQRAAILQDLEIIEKLPESWHYEKGPFIVSTKRRMDIVASEHRAAKVRRWFLYTDAVGLALGFTLTWVLQRYHVKGLSWPDWSALPAVLFVAVMLGWRLWQYQKLTEDATRWHKRDGGNEWALSEHSSMESALIEVLEDTERSFRQMLDTLTDTTNDMVRRANVIQGAKASEYELEAVADRTRLVFDNAHILPEHKLLYLSNTVDSLARIAEQLVARADELP